MGIRTKDRTSQFLDIAHKAYTRSALEPTAFHEERDVEWHIFMKPLQKLVREEEAEWTNLYLSDFEFNQIRLFDVMANKMPLVSLTGQIANCVLADAIEHEAHATVLDVGIGSGQQMVRLVAELKLRREGKTTHLKVIGIEPAAASLAQAKSSLEALQEPNFTIEFVGLNTSAEDMDQQAWNNLKGSQPLVINAAFSLHHIKDRESEDRKDAVLSALKQLSPRVFVLNEPNSDHHNPDFLQRAQNCFEHFCGVFEVIDQIDALDSDKEAIKRHFFAREIEDILSLNEANRSERHESTQMWKKRLDKSGFRAVEHRFEFSNSLPSWLRVYREMGHIGFGTREQMLVATMVVA